MSEFPDYLHIDPVDGKLKPVMEALPKPMSDEKKVSLVTKSHKGVVSIIRDLTMEQAEKLAMSLNVHQRQAAAAQAMQKAGYGSGQFYTLSDSDIVETHIV